MSESMQIPAELMRRTVDRLGESGRQWLEALPEIIAACERQWDVTVGPPFPLTYNYVAPAIRSDGSHAVLKLSFPGDREFKTESAALRLFDGRGMVQLLAVDLDGGAMLLEQLEPGTSLEEIEDDEVATSIAAGVMRLLRRPAPADHDFPTVSYWASGTQRLLRARFGGGTGPLPSQLVAQAESLFADLIASTGEQALLHGDLHHGNIRTARRAPWLAIDPKGVVGDPVFETAAMLHNPWPGLLALPDPRRMLERRIDQLSEELEYDRTRIWAWGLAQAVLSAVWSIDDGSDWEHAIACAELLATLQP